MNQNPQGKMMMNMNFQNKNNQKINLNDMMKQNQEMMAPEEEEQIENASEENIIYNPKIKELNEIDINNKEAIINLLMQDDLITKKQQKN